MIPVSESSTSTEAKETMVTWLAELLKQFIGSALIETEFVDIQFLKSCIEIEDPFTKITEYFYLYQGTSNIGNLPSKSK
jgi:hypothetical protein